MRKFFGNLILYCLRHAETSERINTPEGWRNRKLSETILESADIVKQMDNLLKEQMHKYTQLNHDFHQSEIISKERFKRLEEHIPVRTAITAVMPVKSKQRSGGKHATKR